MKLRVRGNSIRLRLGESEVAELLTSGRVSERVQFSTSPGGSLTYTVVTSPGDKVISACFCENEIKVTLPEAAAKQWATTEQVGMDRLQPISNELGLSILIEKDFRCLVPRPDEDESDGFANPAACTPN